MFRAVALIPGKVMFFEPLLVSDEHRGHYRRLLSEFSGYLGDFVRFTVRVLDVAEAAAAGDSRYCHATILMLARHSISCLDGVSVLVAQGCAEASAPLLRSAFEARLGLDYILRADHDRRALAYQVAHIHRKIQFYRRCDGSDDLGRLLRSELAGDAYVDVLDEVPGDMKANIARLERVLREPPYAEVEAEWQAHKQGKDGRKKGEPNWFSLFSGPRDVKGLAKEVGLLSLYWFLYKHWSDVVHAGSGMENMAVTADGERVVRPVRHPGELQTVVRIASGLCMSLGDSLASAYRPDQLSQFRAEYDASLRPRFLRLCGTRIEFPSWH